MSQHHSDRLIMDGYEVAKPIWEEESKLAMHYGNETNQVKQTKKLLKVCKCAF